MAGLPRVPPPSPSSSVSKVISGLAPKPTKRKARITMHQKGTTVGLESTENTFLKKINYRKYIFLSWESRMRDFLFQKESSFPRISPLHIYLTLWREKRKRRNIKMQIIVGKRSESFCPYISNDDDAWGDDNELWQRWWWICRSFSRSVNIGAICLSIILRENDMYTKCTHQPRKCLKPCWCITTRPFPPLSFHHRRRSR